MDTTPTPEVPETQPVQMANPGVPAAPPTPEPFIGQGGPSSAAGELDNSNSAVTIVWQWVTYGLWEWALISLAILLSSTLSYFFDNADGSASYTFEIYVLAAMLCLLPLAVISNYIYSKKEVSQKHGFSAVIMVLNAVGVFLATIGALITLVVSILSLFTSDNPSTNTNIVIISSLIVTILGAMLFIRIINPAPLAWFTKIFPYLVLLVAGFATVLAIFGPFHSQVANRQDRLIEDNLVFVNDAIQAYDSSNSALPDNLSQVDLTSEQAAQQLVSGGLVTYTDLGTADTTSNANGTIAATSKDKYKLCVTFKSTKKGPLGVSSSTYAAVTDDSLKLDQVATSHPAGNVCYTLLAPRY